MSFDRLAPHYRWMERLLAGEKLQKSRTAFLPELKDVRHALVMGQGRGRFVGELRRAFPQAQITCVDASSRMIEAARREIGEGVEFICHDALTWEAPSSKFDLIVTHFFLDCFRADELAGLILKLSAAGTERCSWLVADFAIPETGMTRLRARVVHGLMYSFFGVVTGISARAVVPPDQMLRKHGFDLQKRVEADWGMIRSDWWRRRAQ